MPSLSQAAWPGPALPSHPFSTSPFWEGPIDTLVQPSPAIWGWGGEFGSRPESSRVSCVTLPGPQPLWSSASSGVDRRAILSCLHLQKGSELGESKCPGMGLGTRKEGSYAALGLMVPSTVPPSWAAVGPSNPKVPSPSQAQTCVPCLGLGPVQATFFSVCLCPLTSLPLLLICLGRCCSA